MIFKVVNKKTAPANKLMIGIKLQKGKPCIKFVQKPSQFIRGYF